MNDVSNFWSVRLSYLGPLLEGHRKRWRDNMQIGIVAQTIEEATCAAKHELPEGCEDPKVWTVNHRGTVDVVVPAETTIEEAACVEIKRLQQWVADCQSAMYINCVYCGHRYGPREDTPVAMADVLKEHIEQCPEHPLSEAKKEIERLQEAMKEIEAVAYGDTQVAEDDTEGLYWIWKRCQKVKGKAAEAAKET